VGLGSASKTPGRLSWRTMNEVLLNDLVGEKEEDSLYTIDEVASLDELSVDGLVGHLFKA